MVSLKRRNPGETEFHQAVEEVAEAIIPFIQDKPKYKDAQILERMCEPDRLISFRETWEDDDGIHDHGKDQHETTDQVNYVKGANIAGFIKVADAMPAYGVM